MRNLRVSEIARMRGQIRKLQVHLNGLLARKAKFSRSVSRISIYRLRLINLYSRIESIQKTTRTLQSTLQGLVVLKKQLGNLELRALQAKIEIKIAANKDSL
jgi:hypothetical protein